MLCSWRTRDPRLCHWTRPGRGEFRLLEGEIEIVRDDALHPPAAGDFWRASRRKPHANLRCPDSVETGLRAIEQNGKTEAARAAAKRALEQAPQ